MELEGRPDLAERLKDAIPAATLIALRPAPASGHPDEVLPDEVLVVERSRELAFAGGMIAFPGGRVEHDDAALGRSIAPHLPPAEAAARIAALRETFEETGLLCALRQKVEESDLAAARRELLDGAPFGTLLAERRWALELDALIPYARWCPPAAIRIARRFDARFYLIKERADAPVSPDLTENDSAFWASPRALMEQAEARQVKMVGPTRATMMRLAAGRSFADAKDNALAFPVREIMPVVRQEGGESWAGVPAGHGYPDVDFRLK
ncbi:MAG: NUDIX hydrolase [Croceicoccus sp.]|nr:NUDIX hydrolase [Croceicoccus sp.]